MKIRLLNEEKTKEDRIRIGEIISKHRKQKGMTQEELSKISGVSRVNISKIEHGAYNVSFDILARLASVIGLDIDLKVNARIVPQPWYDREKITYKPGGEYFVSFGENKALPCTFIRYMDEYNGQRILIRVERGRGVCEHILFPDEIGRTPEEAVERQVTG